MTEEKKKAGRKPSGYIRKNYMVDPEVADWFDNKYTNTSQVIRELMARHMAEEVEEKGHSNEKEVAGAAKLKIFQEMMEQAWGERLTILVEILLKKLVLEHPQPDELKNSLTEQQKMALEAMEKKEIRLGKKKK